MKTISLIAGIMIAMIWFFVQQSAKFKHFCCFYELRLNKTPLTEQSPFQMNQDNSSNSEYRPYHLKFRRNLKIFIDKYQAWSANLRIHSFKEILARRIHQRNTLKPAIILIRKFHEMHTESKFLHWNIHSSLNLERKSYSHRILCMWIP